MFGDSLSGLLTTRFVFSFTDFSGAGVGFSSWIGAGRRWVVIKRTPIVRSNDQHGFVAIAREKCPTSFMSILEVHGTMNVLPDFGSVSFVPDGLPRTSMKIRDVGSNGL